MYPRTRPDIINTCLALMLLCAGLSPLAVQAQTTQRDQEISIRADYMKFDLQTGESVYQGNVSIVQGGIQLTGDTVIMRRDADNEDEISAIEVSGNPARYVQDENTDNKVHAVSQNMKYSARESRLVMTENARLEQADHIVESQRIVYDTENKVIIAGKEGDAPSGSERVNITLTPKKDSPQQ